MLSWENTYNCGSSNKLDRLQWYSLSTSANFYVSQRFIQPALVKLYVFIIVHMFICLLTLSREIKVCAKDFDRRGQKALRDTCQKRKKYMMTSELYFHLFRAHYRVFWNGALWKGCKNRVLCKGAFWNEVFWMEHFGNHSQVLHERAPFLTLFFFSPFRSQSVFPVTINSLP